MSKLCCSIVFNIGIFRTRLEERACSINVKLNRGKVHLRKTLHCVHTKIFKSRGIVLVQKISEFTGRFKFLDGFPLTLFKKDVKLIILLLQMIKTSILLNNIRLQLFGEMPQLLHLVHSLNCQLSSTPTIRLHFTDPCLQPNPFMVHLSSLFGRCHEL